MRKLACSLALLAAVAIGVPAARAQGTDAPGSPPCHDCYRAAAPIGSMSELAAYDADDTRAIDQLLLDADALGLTVREVSVQYVP